MKRHIHHLIAEVPDRSFKVGSTIGVGRPTTRNQFFGQAGRQIGLKAERGALKLRLRLARAALRCPFHARGTGPQRAAGMAPLVLLAVVPFRGSIAPWIQPVEPA